MINTNQIIYLALSVFIISLSAPAVADRERMAFFDINYTKGRPICKLSEFGSKIKPSYFEFPGEKSTSNDFCNIKLSADSFYRYFRYCGLAAIDHKYNNFGSCSFYESGGSFVFSAGVPNNKFGASQTCSFVCLSKVEGNKSN